MLQRICSVWQGEKRVAVVLAAGLLFANELVRYGAGALSKDLQHIHGLPGTASEMARWPGERILFIGNSLTRSAIVAGTVEAEIAQKGYRNPKLFFFYPDATSATHWDYGLRRYFFFHEGHPDRILIGTGPWHLADIIGDASRLGAHYVALRDLPRAWKCDVHGSEEALELVLSLATTLPVDRLRFKPRLLASLVPRYTEVAQAMSRRQLNAVQHDLKSFRHLESLLDSTAGMQIPVTVFSVPVPGAARLPAEAEMVMQMKRAEFCDGAAAFSDLCAMDYRDGYHLGVQAAEAFSKWLGNALD